MIGNLVVLHRDRNALAGQLRCLDGELPIGSGSLSLAYSLFMLESSRQPGALLQELARCLQPEGVLLLISLNPWSPARLRCHWGSTGGSALSAEHYARSAGLELMRKRHLGPCWPAADAASGVPRPKRWLDGLRAAQLLVLRKREAGVTPLRKPAAAVSLRPGMSTG